MKEEEVIETKILYHKNGQMRSKASYKVYKGQRKPHGIHERWHENGQLSYRRNYVNGLKEGPLECFYENGCMELKTWYTYGENKERSGFLISFNEDGKITYVKIYQCGIKHEFKNI